MDGPAARLHETADVETSSADYAARFAGPVGAWFLEVQARATLELLADLPSGAAVLDVGGGHAQLTPALVEARYRVTVVGSDAAAGARLTPWTADGRIRFEVAELLALPYADRAFDVVLCFRLLPHSVHWQALIQELCRVAGKAVVADYPSRRSVNIVAEQLFGWKRRIEKNTRPFALFRPAEVGREFGRHGFDVVASRPQFLWPMVLHRALGSAGAARGLEAPAAALRLTRWFGSPIIVRANRVAAPRS
jgi:SAM-dependent methyltransferase